MLVIALLALVADEPPRIAFERLEIPGPARVSQICALRQLGKEAQVLPYDLSNGAAIDVRSRGLLGPVGRTVTLSFTDDGGRSYLAASYRKPFSAKTALAVARNASKGCAFERAVRDFRLVK